MYCPNCQAEYVAGVKMCPECGVPLVEEPPDETEKEETDTTPETGFIEVYAIGNYTNSQSQIALIKSALDDAGIEYIIQGENFARTMPMVIPIRVMVHENQVDQAREILADLELDQ
jgi:hypothetical protein